MAILKWTSLRLGVLLACLVLLSTGILKNDCVRASDINVDADVPMTIDNTPSMKGGDKVISGVEGGLELVDFGPDETLDKSGHLIIRIGSKRVLVIIGSKSIGFRIRLRNTSRADTIPAGFIIVRDWHGREIIRVPINTQGAVVFAGQTVDLEEYVGNEYLSSFGLYYVSLEVNYSVSTSPLFGEIGFLIIPLWLAIGLTSTVIIVLCLIIMKVLSMVITGKRV